MALLAAALGLNNTERQIAKYGRRVCAVLAVLVAGALLSVHSAMALPGDYSWTAAGPTSTSPRQWYGMASSADGNKLVAVENNSGTNNGYIYTSADGGATWTTRTGAGQ